MSQDSYKETYKELTDRLKAAVPSQESYPAEYFKGINITLFCRCNLEVSWTDKWERHNTKKYDGYVKPRIAVVGLPEAKNYESFELKEAVKRIFRYTLKVLYDKLLQFIEYSGLTKSYITDLKVSIGKDEYDIISLQIENITAWDYGHVYIWHEEQECGEGWIIASRDPEWVDEQTNIILN